MSNMSLDARIAILEVKVAEQRKAIDELLQRLNAQAERITTTGAPDVLIDIKTTSAQPAQKSQPDCIIEIPVTVDGFTFERNREAADARNLDHCPCCGRAIQEPKYFINSIYGGSMYPKHDKNVYEDAWVMGVGSECRKSIPADYVMTAAELEKPSPKKPSPKKPKITTDVLNPIIAPPGEFFTAVCDGDEPRKFSPMPSESWHLVPEELRSRVKYVFAPTKYELRRKWRKCMAYKLGERVLLKMIDSE